MTPHPAPKILLTHFDWNLHRMDEMLKQENTEYFRHASLQRFGFTVDMALKCVRAFAEARGESCETAEQCFRLAAHNRWMEEDADWKDLTDSYHLIMQKPKGEPADTVYGKLPRYYSHLKSLYTHLSGLVG